MESGGFEALPENWKLEGVTAFGFAVSSAVTVVGGERGAGVDFVSPVDGSYRLHIGASAGTGKRDDDIDRAKSSRVVDCT